MIKMKNIFIVLILCISIALMFAPLSRVHTSKAVNGTINISGEDLTKYEAVEIGGQWELYYGRLLSTNEIMTAKPECYYNVPGKLEEQINGCNSGYMTLHFKVQTPYDGIYGMQINNMFTAAEVYINGEKIDGYGKVGKTANKEKPTYRQITCYFPSKDREVDVVIHTSAYKDVHSSIKNVAFGTKENISRRSYTNVFLDSFIIGVLTIASLINLGCYSPKCKNKGNLYFAAMCVFLILQQSITGSVILCQIVSYVPYEIINKIKFVSVYLMIVCYILFIDNLFEQNMKIKKAVIWYGVFFTTVCMITDSSIYTRTLWISQLMVSMFMVYIVFFIYARIRAKDSNVESVIIPFIILVMCAVNGILVSNEVWESNYISIFGVLIFVISQSMYIVKDYVKNYQKLQRLNKDSLTSLYNNKYIKKLVNQQIEKYIAKDKTFSLMMIDIDDFKHINDTFGHMFGDTVIMAVADIIKEVIDEHGYIGRFGGDEFVVILPSIDKNKASDLANDILVKAKKLNEAYNMDKRISLSIGVYENKSKSLEECMKCADNAMYISKRSGKDRVTSY